MEDFCYGIVGNIPSELRSADLRAFFSQFIESKGFQCFHYRHRPEVQRSSKTDLNKIEKDCEKTCCCVIKVYRNKMDDLIRMYSGQNWTNSAGKLLRHKVLISKIKLCHETAGRQIENSYLTRQEQQQTARTVEEFVESDLKRLLEMNPPAIMPNGNVGTPLTVFIELIRACKFPPHLIKKLGLTFPRSKKRKYGNVPFDYDIFDPRGKSSSSGDLEEYNENSDDMCLQTENTDHQQAGSTAATCSVKQCPHTQADTIADRKLPTLENLNQTLDSNTNNLKSTERNKLRNISDSENDENSDNETEEWDRHATLHNDITSQERSKERLYEDNIELKWEKGGSGLVWYTDAAFWKKQEEADFDEETTDDWDVDMSIYEEEGAGDLDAKTLLQLRVEQEWKRGKNIDLNRVGGFEKYTRGFGGEIMRKQGWREGESLGSSQVGITEPISSDGQKPSSKRGLGFYGEKLNRCVKRPRPTREAVISTVYDIKEDRNPEIFHSEGPYNIKYRDKVDFVPETKSY